MECSRGGSSTPSYKEVTTSRGKSPLGKVRGSGEEGGKNNEKELNGDRSKENSSTKDNEEEDKSQGTRDKYQNGPCRPKMEITSRVVLNDSALQEHREHMGTYPIIYKVHKKPTNLRLFDLPSEIVWMRLEMGRKQLNNLKFGIEPSDEIGIQLNGFQVRKVG